MLTNLTDEEVSEVIAIDRKESAEQAAIEYNRHNNSNDEWLNRTGHEASIAALLEKYPGFLQQIDLAADLSRYTQNYKKRYVCKGGGFAKGVSERTFGNAVSREIREGDHHPEYFTQDGSNKANTFLVTGSYNLYKGQLENFVRARTHKVVVFRTGDSINETCHPNWVGETKEIGRYPFVCLIYNKDVDVEDAIRFAVELEVGFNNGHRFKDIWSGKARKAKGMTGGKGKRPAPY